MFGTPIYVYVWYGIIRRPPLYLLYMVLHLISIMFDNLTYIFLSIDDCSRDAAICDVNARCVRQGNTMICSCNQGYRGDGRRCARMF